MMQKWILLLLLSGTCSMQAQELNCSVTINAQQSQGTDRRVYETLKNAITEFMNNTKWTNDLFKSEERIECALSITITNRKSIEEFDAGVVVTARRPVYKTNYTSLLLNFTDPDFSFRYVEFQPLEFNENTFTSNLTSMLGFYAYIILGIDYDSFSQEGGTVFFQKAQTIMNNAQNTPDRGWKAFDGTKTRYWLAEGFVNGNFKALRQTYYKYHRKGLDVMATDPEGGRAAIAEALDNLKIVHNIVPGSFMMQQFFWAKADEAVNLFTPSPPDQKNKINTLLNTIDPGNGAKYQKLTQ
ncbi:MAG: DUF4835 family protein [Bacteroidota bacterium]